MYQRPLLLCLLVFWNVANAQDSTQVLEEQPSKFDQFNKKAEKVFRYFPVPLYSYTSEAGNIFGLAKYNLVDLVDGDTISQPSKFAELITISTKGRIKVAIGSDIIWHENKYMVLSGIVYSKQNEYILGVGNEIDTSKLEEYGYSRFEFVSTFYMMLFDNLYAGLGFDISDYTRIDFDSTGVLSDPDIVGTEPTTNFGITLALLRDGRDNRYNPLKGSYLKSSYTFFPSFLGNSYIYQFLTLDVRKYLNPWYKHVIALQTSGTFCSGQVPFYDLAMLGGDSQMRGYYKGALRDKVLIDAQIEYRMPIWSIFGITTWLGTGRVAKDFASLSLNGFWLSYGLGLRVMVDSKNQTNLRFDFGFGPHGIRGFYINFTEAF